MYIGKKIIYIELEKTGSSQICSLLDKYDGGVIISKHNRLINYLGDRTIIGSIRNPWDWYLSLWSFGCQRQGREYKMLSTWQWKKILGGRQPLFFDRKKWRRLYRDVNDHNSFKEWLKMLLDSSAKSDIQEGFSRHSISSFAGFYTYRFLRMYATDQFLNANLNSFEAINEFDQQNNIIDLMIRTESLSTDVTALLTSLGVMLTKSDQNDILAVSNNPLNRSFRDKSIPYYDQETAELVRTKETFLIEKFNFNSGCNPNLTPQ